MQRPLPLCVYVCTLTSLNIYVYIQLIFDYIRKPQLLLNTQVCPTKQNRIYFPNTVLNPN